RSPSGPCMTKLNRPPGRGSITTSEMLQGFGANHCCSSSGVIQAFQMRSGEALIVRRSTRLNSCATPSVSQGLFSISRATVVSLLNLLQVRIQPVEAGVPEAAVVLQPLGDAPQRHRLQPGGTPLRLASPADQPGLLQHLQV